ncbi:MAG: hypothetical protein AAB834_04720, partial [Patescibacteria group bacterium]
GRAGFDVNCGSAGILEVAEKGCASPFAVAAAKRIGIDLSEHRRRRLTAEFIGLHDLYVCADEEVAVAVLAMGVEIKRIYNAQVSNPWPVQFQTDYDRTAEAIMAAMYRVIARYFSVE